ncbi:AAA family ATPase [Gordonia sp. TBRC 11910]|uniref:AAA family ATPase n=1 Tax=Gordonia asplenii TaxID=2725283 RepID=A0A848KZ05_9ACTN|nr:LuxR C-terminal-related transcriptional regulator [Gordonia asplenii]NMO00668.1 AAA family ATPase [Gordonia asplenii]
MSGPGEGVGDQPQASTKFESRMTRRGLVRRQRLLDALATGRTNPLTVIHGPAGFGKSTLAAQWQDQLRSEGVAVGWLSIDRDDNNPVWFVRDLIAAITRAQASLGSGLISILEQHSGDGVRAVMAGLIEQIVDDGRPLAVVIDDWHLIDDAATTDVFEYLLDFCPDNLNVIVTSRTRMHAVATLRVRSRLTEIDARQLRFDRRESSAFLREMNALTLADDDVQALWATTDGWVAALQLATLSLRNSGDPAAVIAGFSGRHHSIGEYLAEAVLDSLSPELLDFLLTTSICDRLCASLAAAVSGHRDGGAMLDELRRRNLFLVSLDDEDVWYRYHHLFAGYLRRRLERDYPERVTELNRVASVWFAEHGHLSDAVDHALVAGEPERAADLVEERAMAFVEQSRMATLLGLVDKLPGRIVAARATLQMAIAWAYCLLHRLDEADLALVRARSLADDPPAAVSVETDLLAACIDVYGDRIDRVRRLTAPILEHPNDFRPFVVAGAANLLSFVDLHTFRYEQVRATQRSVSGFQELNPGAFAPVYGKCFVGLAETARLDLDAAERNYRDAVAIATQNGGSGTYAQRLAAGQLGILLYERDDLDAAETLIGECLLLGVEGGVADLMILTYTTMARIRALRENYSGAIELLGDARKVAGKLRLPRLASAADQELTTLLVMMGDLAGARDVVTRNQVDFGVVAAASADSPPNGIVLSIRRSQLAMRTKLLLAQGDIDGATKVAAARLDEARAAPWPYEEMAARVALAEVVSVADRDDAARILAPAVIVGNRVGLIRTIVDGGPAIARVLGDLLDSQRVGRHVDDVPAMSADYLRTLVTSTQVSASNAIAVAPAHGKRRAMPEEQLNGREIDILKLLERGMPNSAIARGFGIKLNTVKWYLKNIYTKLGVTSRAEAVAEARRRALID